MTPDEAVAEVLGLPEAISGTNYSALLGGPVWGQLIDGVVDNFQGSVEADGTPWKPRKDKLPHPLLVKSTLMFLSATGVAAGAIKQVDANTLIFGVDLNAVPYARAQHYGRTEINLPARPYLDVSEKRLLEVDRIIADGIEAIVWRVGADAT